MEGVSVSHRPTAFGIVITVEITRREFEIHLEGKYPFQPPKLLSRSVTDFPSISDGRDLLQDVIQRNWTPNITAHEIINNLPRFLVILIQEEVREKITSETSNVEFGVFHLGHPMYLDTWDRKQGMASFQAIELDPQNPKFKKNRRIVVTHTVLLQLEVSNQFPGIGHLVSWATLQALSNIKRSKSDPSKLTFQWKQMGSSPPFAQLFQVSDADSCIDLISRNMNRMGAIVKRQNPMPNLKEEEVTSKSIKRTKIDEILHSIAVYESNLEINLNIDMINSLMSLYQQAIEYYSAINDDRFQDFIMRLHKMLGNEVIQTVLQSQQEVTVKSNSKLIERQEETKVPRESTPQVVRNEPKDVAASKVVSVAEVKNEFYIPQVEDIHIQIPVENLPEEIKQEEVSHTEIKSEEVKQQLNKPEVVEQQENKFDELKQQEAKQLEVEELENKPEELKQLEVEHQEAKQLEANQEELKQEELKQEELKQEELKQEELKQEELKQEELKQEELKQEENKQEELKQEEDIQQNVSHIQESSEEVAAVEGEHPVMNAEDAN